MIGYTEEGSRPGPAVDPVETLAALRTVPDVCDAVVTAHVGIDRKSVV